MFHRYLLFAMFCAGASSTLAVADQPPDGYSLHGEQEGLAPASAEQEVVGKVSTASKAVIPAVEKSDWVVLGYVQRNDPRWGYHWHALTHLALPFTGFDSNGDITNLSTTITNRSLLYKTGGMADRYGVKVLMTLVNSGFNTATLDSVMQNSAKRTNLATQVAAAVNNGSDNIAGVNLDFEPVPYSTGTGQGIVDFIVELRGLLNPGKEISYYVGPTYHASSYPNLATAAANLDFVNISCYPYSGSWSSTSTSINPLNSYLLNVDRFMTNGVPPEKMVLTLGTYGYRMDTSSDAYGATKNFNIGSTGFADAKYKTTLSSTFAPRNFHTPSESPWYASWTGSSYEHAPYEDEQSLEIKMRNAQSWIGDTNTGSKLGGVGFWSLAWLGRNFLGVNNDLVNSYYSYDMEAGASSDKIRTYPHVYQQMQEIFAPPGENEYLLEGWEYHVTGISTALESQWDRWRNPDEGNDKAGLSSATRSIVSTPAGTGAPENSDFCARLDFSFTATPNNHFFYRWEILGDAVDTGTPDINATRGFFKRTSKVKLDIHTPASYAGRTVSMILMDANGELEQGPAFSLNASGWRTIETDVANDVFTPYVTTFNQYQSGNGAINTAGGGARDIAFIGLLVEGGGTSGSGQLHIDQLRYTHSNVGGLDYKINEFAYRLNDGEFVEISGPAGAIPAGVELRVYTATNGAIQKTVVLAGLVIPASGILAVGDPAIAGVTSSVGFGNATDDLPGSEATALQLYNTTTGGAYDSVVYRAHGGIGMLVRPETHGVTAEGYPWLGEAATGLYSLGRFPDGADTDFNYDDFAAQPDTPGLPNGTGLQSLPVVYDFDATLPGDSAFLTYNWASAGVQAPGTAASPNGGNVYRVADSFGGNIAFFADPILQGENGYWVEGHIHIPTSAEGSHGLGVGICGTLGSTFFTNSPGGSGYENGYWLLYNNEATLELNNGLGNHSQTFKFVMAQNNNMNPNPVLELGSATLAATGAAAGTWTNFLLAVDPASNNLRAEVNETLVYDGPIPDGGRTSGAFQAGHRKQSGGITSTEGLWLDALSINSLPAPITTVPEWQLLAD